MNKAKSVFDKSKYRAASGKNRTKIVNREISIFHKGVVKCIMKVIEITE